jgi:hypothetical protein
VTFGQGGHSKEKQHHVLINVNNVLLSTFSVDWGWEPIICAAALGYKIYIKVIISGYK